MCLQIKAFFVWSFLSLNFIWKKIKTIEPQPYYFITDWFGNTGISVTDAKIYTRFFVDNGINSPKKLAELTITDIQDLYFKKNDFEKIKKNLKLQK
jgi:hypothetical protein